MSMFANAGRHPRGAKRARAALLAALPVALLVAGTSLPAHAAGENGDKDNAGQARSMSVQEAWTNAKQDWRELQEASGEAWGEARQEFEESWSRLQNLMQEQDGAAPPPDDPAAPKASQKAE